MCQTPFTHHKTFAANFYDPLGFFGGKKGFMGLGENKNEKRDREAAYQEALKASRETPKQAEEPISNVQNRASTVKKKQITNTLLTSEEDSVAASGPKLYNSTSN